MQKQPSKRDIRRTVGILVLVAAFAVGAFLIGRQVKRYRSGAQVQSQVEELFYGQNEGSSETEPTDLDQAEERSESYESYENTDDSKPGDSAIFEENSELPESTPLLIYTKDEDIPEYDFTTLLEINQDVKGWLHIPAAEIDNPIVQAEDNDYYLHRNIYGEEEYEGTFFFDHRCVWGESRNCVIYGHAMLDGSMMYKLRNLLDQAIADENPAFLYITPEHVYECQIFSAYRTTIYDDYIWFQFFGDDDFLNYVDMMKEKSEVIFPDCGITAEDRILTISTCNRTLINDGTGRMAVYAKIVEIR